MTDPVDALVLDLLEWIGPAGRPYDEVMEAWRTSCPRLTVWEEANTRGYVEQRSGGSRGSTVRVTDAGSTHLAARRGRSVSTA